MICDDITAAMPEEQRRLTDARRQQHLFEQAPGFIAILRGPRHVFEFVNRAYATLFGNREFIGETVRDAFPDIAGQGFYEALDETFATGKSYLAHHVPVRLQRSNEAQVRELLLDFIYEPVLDESGAITGIFVQGNDVTEAHFAHEALRAIERRQTFRIELDAALRVLSDPNEIVAVATKQLGRQLSVDRCNYAEVDEDAGSTTIEVDWSNGSEPSTVGRRPLSELGPQMLAKLRSGQAYQGLDPIAGAATIWTDDPSSTGWTVPLVQDEVLVAFTFVQQAAPRRWTDDEEELVRDVAERIHTEVARGRAETALRQSEEEYRFAQEVNPQAPWTADPAGQVVSFNRRWLALTGLSREAAAGDGWAQAVHADDRDAMVAAWTLSVATGLPFDVEHRIYLAQGGSRWMRSRAQPRLSLGGDIIRWYGATEDVHDCKLARQALQDLAETLEARVEQRTAERDMTWRISRDVFLVCGFDGLYRSANPAWSDALGYAPEELSGTRFDTLAHPDDVAATRNAFERVRQGEVIRDFEMRMRAKGGNYVRYRWLCIPEGDLFYAAGRAVITG